MAPQARERLGVFGGTFDPPHVGHLVSAVNVQHALGLDRVLLVVANVPWQKAGSRPISAAADRLAMVEAAVEGVPGLEACDLELVRGGPSYSVDTLQALIAERADRDLFLILGSDAAAGLDTWERPEELRELATFVVVDRPGGTSDVTVPDGFRALHVEVPRLEVSSTDLRARVVDGRPLDYLLTPAVISSIEARRLYRVPG
jgi:nicotinate-nucleotide adenylyltransferase